MSYQLCLGRECKLGWGYNEPLNQLVPVNGEPRDITWKVKDSWEYFVYSLSSTEIPHWASFLFFEKVDLGNFRNGHVSFWNPVANSSWISRSSLTKMSIGKFNVVFTDEDMDPENFRNIHRTIRYLFDDRNLTPTQKKLNCKVLINYDEVKEMTFGELLDFMGQLDEGRHPQYNIPIEFEIEQLTREAQETATESQNHLGMFLSYLYCIYRKIEIKMIKAGYPDILPDLNFKEKLLEDIYANLKKAKEDYISMDRKDFLNMYRVSKKLFFRYIDYIKYSISHGINMDEENDLPGIVDELKSWLSQLNRWVLINNNGEWTNHISSDEVESQE